MLGVKEIFYIWTMLILIPGILINQEFFCFPHLRNIPSFWRWGKRKGELMKKGLFITLKVIMTLVLILIGLLSLTSIKLSGFKIGSWEVSAEQVRMFVTTAGDYLFWVYVVVVVFIIWKKRIKK